MTMLVLTLIVFTGMLSAQTSETEFAFFKRTIAPVMAWGENGVLTIPKATTLGKLNFYVAGLGQQAGTLEGIDLYLTSASLMIGTSEDVELGYTRRQLIWEDLYLTNLSMDTFHFKARVLDFGKYILPQAAIGLNAVSLRDNQFEEMNDILFNPYLAVTTTIPVFTTKILLSATGVAETIWNANEFGSWIFNVGADLNLFDVLFLVGELQGFNPEKANNEVLNAGVKLKLGGVSIGVGMFNIIRQKLTGGDIIDNFESSTFDLSNAKYIATVAFEVKLGKLFAPKKQ